MKSGEEVDGSPIIARGDMTEVFELVEETLNQIAISVEKWAERWFLATGGFGLNVGPAALVSRLLAKCVAIVGAVGEKNLARAQGVHHLKGGGVVVCLSLGEL